MTTPVCTIDATGIHAPAFSDCLSYFTSGFQNIYGPDIYLANDSPDGQIVGIIAAALNDVNAMCVAVYNAFSPTTAQGTGLSSVVKINGLSRLVPSLSTVTVAIGGQSGTVISNGVIKDSLGNLWDLPATVTIPGGGTISVTATAEQPGAISIGAQTFTIQNPTRGWQTAISSGASAPGLPVESDAALRTRQSVSTEQPAITVMQSIIGAIASLPGVTRYAYDENDSGLTDSNSVPAHTISVVVEGGAIQDIVNAIGLRKTPGTGTFGTTSGIYTNSSGIPLTISFFQPTQVTILVTVNISVVGYTGYTTAIGTEIINSITAYINALPIGGENGLLRYTRLYVPAQLVGPYSQAASPADGTTYELLSVAIARSPGSPAQSDVALAFNEAAVCVAANVTLNVTS